MFSLNVNTITSAQRAVKLLKRYNIKSQIGRLKKPSKADGCGYTVNTAYPDLNEVVGILKSAGIAVSRVDTL